MLQQILKDMYVDPEILAELPEEQKEMLFYKMRQEQIRRYNEYSKKSVKRSVKQKTGKRVRILEDRNGDPWTWILGEEKGEVTAKEKWKRTEQAKLSVEAENKKSEKTGVKRVIANDRREDSKDSRNNSLRQNGVQVKPKANQRQRSCENGEAAAGDKLIIVRMSQRRSPTSTPSPVLRRKLQQGLKKQASDENRNSQQTNTSTQSNRSPLEVHPMLIDLDDKPTNQRRNNVPPTLSQSKSCQPSEQNSHSIPKVSRATDKCEVDSIAASPPRSESRTPAHRATDSESTYEGIYESLDKPAVPETVSNEEWQKQLEKYKLEDERRSSRARRASKEYQRQSMIASDPNKLKEIRKRFQRMTAVEESGKNTRRVPPPLPAKPPNLQAKVSQWKNATANKPQNRQEIITWFNDTQHAVWRGITTPTWFHGIISRQQAERQLVNAETGAFLIRVSDKLWGYALSYKDTDRVKHFLIDASKPQCFHFFGIDQINHETLADLTDYHKAEPISYNNELLKKPIGQRNPSEPDFSELTIKMDNDTRL